MKKIEVITLTLVETKLDSFLSALRQKHILIDANFLIDASNHKGSFSFIIDSLKKNGCTLVAIDGVYHEFIRGRRSLENFIETIEY